MDERKSVWLFVLLHVYCLLAAGKACQVDNGEFYTIITVKEEAETGMVVGSLNIDKPETVESMTVVDDNPYFEYFSANNSFVVKSRIDIDEGLSTLQTMTLECTPKEGPKLEIEVEFELEDINDFTPEFQPTNRYTFAVSEAAIAGSQVGVVVAKDRDIKNSYVTYELQPSVHSNYFELKAVSGGKANILLNRTLDYERDNSYNLTIIAKDCQHRHKCGSKQRSALAEVTVVVEDADDLSPEFDQSTYTASIFEDSILGTAVVQLVAKDQDKLNEPVMYSIDGEGSRYFSINEKTGMVTVTDTSGMIKGTQYLLQAKAWQVNDITKRASTSLVIKVVATNGNAPQFTERSYDVTLSESSPVGTTAVTFTVTDRDTDGDFFGTSETSQMKFSIKEYPAEFPFRLVITGSKSADLRVSAPLDYELTKKYTLILEVSDGEFMSKTSAHITILNENDHNPEFNQSAPYIFHVKWESGAIVGMVKAIDKDASDGTLSPVTYKILPPHDNLFAVNNKGQITLTGELKDYKTRNYLINVLAMDKGKSPRSSTATVKITLQDLPALPTTGSSLVQGSEAKNSDRMVIYIVAGIAGFLLILVALFVMCFLKRRAKKAAKQLRKKDAELQQSYDKPFAVSPGDTLKSQTDSQLTNESEPVGIVYDDMALQSQLNPVLSGDSNTSHSSNNRSGRRLDYAGLKLAESDGEDSVTIQHHSEPNNLSVVSDSEQECMEMVRHPVTNNSNIPPVPNQLTLKCSSDSGRSSMREDRSPVTKRVPFQSFLHPKSASIDETGRHNQEEIIALSTLHSRTAKGLLPTHSNSFNTGYQGSDISNIRATEGPPVRTAATLSQHSIDSSVFIAEVPEGFRTSESYRTKSPQSRTSDYESNTPTPEITSDSIIDYCEDLPTQGRKAVYLMNGDRDQRVRSAKNLAGSLYLKASESNTDVERSDTPSSEVSTETESTINEDTNARPQMTIYF